MCGDALNDNRWLSCSGARAGACAMRCSTASSMIAVIRGGHDLFRISCWRRSRTVISSSVGRTEVPPAAKSRLCSSVGSVVGAK